MIITTFIVEVTRNEFDETSNQTYEDKLEECITFDELSALLNDMPYSNVVNITIKGSSAENVITETDYNELKERIDNIYSKANDISSYVRSAIDELEDIQSFADDIIDECDH